MGDIAEVLGSARDHSLDVRQTVGEILISGRQCPEGMHVVRQHTQASITNEWVKLSIPIASRRA